MLCSHLGPLLGLREDCIRKLFVLTKLSEMGFDSLDSANIETNQTVFRPT